MWSAIVGREGDVELYAAAKDGALKRFEEVEFSGVRDMPEQGDFAVERDRETVKKLQEDMVAAFGHAIVRQRCQGSPTEVDLSQKMLQDQHVPTLCEFIASGALTHCTLIDLQSNNIGDDGLISLSSALAEGALAQATKILLQNN